MAQSKFTLWGPEKLKDQWIDACASMKTSQTAVFTSLIEFFLSLDEDTRSRLVRNPLAIKVTTKKGR